MKRSLTLPAIALFLAASLWQCSKSNPDLITENPRTIPFTSEAPVIDGSEKGDLAWKDPEWFPIDQVWLGQDQDIMDFSGKYALSWTEDRLYLLVKIVDDTLVDTHQDGLVDYWEDDCVEFFIDEDRSGGDHQFNFNAFAYHVALDLKVVDYGTEGAMYFDHVKSAKKHIKNVTVWEFEIEVYDDSYTVGKDNQPVKLTPNKDIGFAVAYCDSDESGTRESFIGSEKILAEDKNIGWKTADIFGHFRLVK